MLPEFMAKMTLDEDHRYEVRLGEDVTIAAGTCANANVNNNCTDGQELFMEGRIYDDGVDVVATPAGILRGGEENHNILTNLAKSDVA